ncbi:MAG: hypothetical protein R3B13_21640 [Polyangiaceae bacterium]
MSEGELPDPTLDALWRQVVADWDNDKSHAAYLEMCNAKNRLAEAAARYRGMAGDRERGASAEKRLQAVLALALAQLELLRSPPPEAQRRFGGVALTLFFVGGILLILAYLGLHR